MTCRRSNRSAAAPAAPNSTSTPKASTSSDLEVDLKPTGRPKTEIVADIRARLAVLPLSINVGQPISHRLDHMLSGVRAEIALKIFGEDLDALRCDRRGAAQTAGHAFRA